MVTTKHAPMIKTTSQSGIDISLAIVSPSEQIPPGVAIPSFGAAGFRPQANRYAPLWD
jgi:hypothetical protein